MTDILMYKDINIKYKDIVFSVDCPISTGCLDGLQKHQDVYKNVYKKKRMEDAVEKLAQNSLHKNIAVDGDMLIGKRTGNILRPEVDYTCYKKKF